MRDFYHNLYKSIFAGIFIAIGAAANIKLGGVIGAVIFSVGLICILTLKLKLYTGAIGFAKTTSDFINCAIILVGNIVGTLTITVLIPGTSEIMLNKIEVSPLTIFFRAMICGFLIHAAVFAYKKYNNLLVTCFAVPAFILIGAEHSIADFAYLWCSPNIDMYQINYLLIIILGNACGSLLLDKAVE